MLEFQRSPASCRNIQYTGAATLELPCLFYCDYNNEEFSWKMKLDGIYWKGNTSEEFYSALKDIKEIHCLDEEHHLDIWTYRLNFIKIYFNELDFDENKEFKVKDEVASICADCFHFRNLKLLSLGHIEVLQDMYGDKDELELMELFLKDTMESLPYKDKIVCAIPTTNGRLIRKQLERNNIVNKFDNQGLHKLNREYYDLLKGLSCRGGLLFCQPGFYPNVHSYDISSSYPYIMMTKVFPADKPIRDVTADPEELRRSRQPFIIKFKVSKIEPKYFNYFRLDLEAKEYILTSIDYFWFIQAYEIEGLEVLDLFYFRGSKKLPLRLRNYILEEYEGKQAAKEINHTLYVVKKVRVNSIFGAFDREPGLDEKGNPKSQLFPWTIGIFTEAYGRSALMQIAIQLKRKLVYCDTDCVRFIGEFNFDKINKARKKFDCDLGVWEHEFDGMMYVWKAKIYAYKTNSGKTVMKCSGLNTKIANDWLRAQNFYSLNENSTIPKSFKQLVKKDGYIEQKYLDINLGGLTYNERFIKAILGRY